MKMKSSKVVAFLLTFIVLLSQVFISSSVFAADTATNVAPTTTTEKKTDVVPVTIFHTNDMHGRLAYEEYKGTPNSYGVAREKALIDKEKKENPDRTTVVLDAGDAFQGLPISNESKGEDMAKAMNEIGYSAMTAGNHEFDFSLNTIEKYKDGWLNFPIVSSNVYKDGKLLFKPSTIIKKDGLKIGVVGVTTPETATKTNPTGIVGVTFAKPIPAVKNAIQDIKDQVDFITVLAHLGDDTTTLTDEKGSTLAKVLSEDPMFNKLSILVIDGHSHQVIQNNFVNVHQAQTGSYLANIGKITFNFDKTTKQIVDYKSEMLSAKDNAKDLVPDAKLTEIVKEAQDKFDAKGREFLFHNNTTLNGESTNVRTKETNLGNVIADALESYKGFTHESDFAVTNGGGIRTTLNKDLDITLGDVIKVLPFGNQLTQIKVKGSDVKAMYEHSLRAAIDKDKDGNNVLDIKGKPQLGSNGGFLHSSSSIKIYFNPELKAGERVLKIEILNKKTNKFEQLDLTKEYYMATNDFLAVGGDGFTMLGGAREESGLSMDRAFADFLKTAKLTSYADEFPYSRIIPGALPTVLPEIETSTGEPVFKEELPYFDLNADYDNDGYTNKEELLAGTDPEDVFSYPKTNTIINDTSNNIDNSTKVDTTKETTSKVATEKETTKEVKTTTAKNILPKTGLETTSSVAGFGLLAALIVTIIKRKVK